MDLEHLEASLKDIRHLLSHLHGEITGLEKSYSEVLHVLRKLEYRTEHDDLTGLLRRKPFFKKWEEILEECSKLNENCGLLLIDIDHFKSVNDNHGHPTGDEVLKRVAELLKRFESPACVTGRYGGEEFAVAVRGSDAELLGTAELIRRGAERLHGPVLDSDGNRNSKTEWRCTLSVGIASSEKVGLDITRLLEAADQALYKAKRAGRNQVKVA